MERYHANLKNVPNNKANLKKKKKQNYDAYPCRMCKRYHKRLPFLTKNCNLILRRVAISEATCFGFY